MLNIKLSAEEIAEINDGQIAGDNELSDALYQKLFDHFTANGEMPYGVAHARTGDPFDWIFHRLSLEFPLAAA